MIKEYTFGQIKINSKTYTSDLIIYPDRINDNWWRKEGHLLLPEDLKEVIKVKPDVLVVGTGNPGLMKVPTSTKEWITSKGIKLIIEPTEKACQTYNKLSNSEKRVVAALHLTC